MAFSRAKLLERALAIKIDRNITLAKAGNNSDFKLAHPDWVREAQQKNYIMLKKVTTELVQKHQSDALKRRQKLIGNK